MNTTYALPQTLSPNFTFDARPTETWAILSTAEAIEAVGSDVLVPAPYDTPELAGVNRWAVVVTWDDESQLVGGVLQTGPRSFEAWKYNGHAATHSFGTFRSAIQAAAYMILITEF